MNIHNYITWNLSPEIFSLGGLSIRWYGLLFALGFFFAYIVLYHIFKREKVEVKVLDRLAVFFFIAVVIGARLGHVFFYQWDYYKNHLSEIPLVWQGGLASHGAGIGIIIALIIYIKVYKVNTWWLFNRVAIIIPIAAAFVRFGNLANSEIYGNETTVPWAFIYERGSEEKSISSDFVLKKDTVLTNDHRFDRTILLKQGTTFGAGTFIAKGTTVISNKSLSTEVEAPFNKPIIYLNDQVMPSDSLLTEDIYLYSGTNIKSGTVLRSGSVISASKILNKDPCHPTQLYEAFSYLLISLLLYFIWRKNKTIVRPGLLVGLFLVLMFTARFLIEFVKIPQEKFNNTTIFNMGQWLSIPFVILGILFIGYSFFAKKPPLEAEHKDTAGEAAQE
jgi:phosphatidylglycerol---prolipoprotein diacylglyceryl transferase